MSDSRWESVRGGVSLDVVDFEQRYRAASTRDARFDGMFVTAVRTTGIYCRPSCPARTPKPTNVEFFPTAAGAHEHGYRACKVCLPDAVAGSPEWNLRSDVAGRAMRLIADGVVEREGVTGLAHRLGYTARHLNRLLVAELGAGPLALARAQRAQTARQLLVGTDLPISDVAFAAGFGSIRQFNDTIAEVYALNPSALRASRRHPASPELSGGGGGGGVAGVRVSLRLPVREPFDAAGVFTWLAARAIPGVEDASADRYSRTLRLPGGPATFTVRPAQGGLRLDASPATLADLGTLVTRVRRLFDADADPVGIDTALAADPRLVGSIGQTPGIRLPGTVDPVEMLFRALVGQQISVAAARTHLGRLAAAAGDPLPVPHDGLSLLFPTPAAIAAHGGTVLTGPATRIANIVRIAERLAAGELALGYGDDPAEQRAALTAEPGIGAWTADYVAMRVLGDPDVLPTGDVALRTGAARLGLSSTPKDLAEWGRTVSPWRSYASLHLWRASAGTPASDRKAPR
jgi:AraC family transcriptional regulator of adaptative response / DNA-3-methyladenine glycosylase II